MKVSSRIESIFSQAAALANCGRFKSIIYCIKDNVYLLNTDNTILLKFQLREVEGRFDKKIIFNSSDYDSRTFYEENDKIIFLSYNEKYQRRKICKNKFHIDVEKLYNRFPQEYFSHIKIDKSICGLIEDSLSHIELSFEDGIFKITQRDIYSGNIIEITKKLDDNFGLDLEYKLKTENIPPIGMRKNDFLALFAFQNSIKVGFNKRNNYCSIIGTNRFMHCNGIISHCIYDELGTLEEMDYARRKKPKVGDGKQKVDPKISKRKQNKNAKRGRK